MFIPQDDPPRGGAGSVGGVNEEPTYSPQHPIRIAVVDDQAMVREGFGALLGAQADIEVVGSAADGIEALELVRRHRPDVILMDIRMPRLDGLGAARQILALSAGAPRIIMLTTFDSDEYVFDALRTGASGFLLKDATAAELVQAVHVVAQGEALLSPAVTKRVIADYSGRPQSGHDAALLEGLTEREVMREIAAGRSNSEVAEALFLSEHTVKTHISRILGKLSLRDRTQIVVVAYESGLVTAGDWKH
jgi:DNA-binding NarL/FixJ family response regulator